MEEDINILEDWIEISIGNAPEWVKSDEIIKIIDYKQIQAIENLIKGYREKEESEKYLYDAYQDAGKKMFEYAEQLEDSIPKSKIKAKIEELEKENEQTYTKFLASDRANANLGTKGKMIEGAILVLKELMEDK